MATEKKIEEKAVKPKTGKAPAAAKAALKAKPAKAPKSTAPAKAVKPAFERVVDGKIKVTQLIGSIGRQKDQEATLKGLGLNKRHRSKVLENSPEVRGMVYKVRHLVKVEKA